MGVDPEVKAMGDVAVALGELEEAARKRVLDWACQRFGVVPTAPARHQGGGQNTASSEAADEGAGGPREFNEFHELFEAAAPSSGLDQILVACYWFQVVKGESKLDGQAVNAELKHMGHGSSNITRDINALIGRSPALVMKIRKDGSTKQARNQYKLTRAGIQAVEELLARA